MKYLLIAVAFILILFSLISKETNIQSLNSSDTILAFGDSLTSGYNAKPNESYPAVLSRLSGHKVINAGIPSETSHDGLRRIAPLLEDDSIKLMVLFFGGNDIMQGLSMEHLKSNLKAMIQMAKDQQINVLLISVPNLSLFGLSPLTLYKKVADEENVPLLSGMMANILEKPSLKSDQIHPNALGYKIMGEKIYEKLKEITWLK